MYVAELRFPLPPTAEVYDALLDAIDSLLGCLRMNGQILGLEFPTWRRAGELVSLVMIPEPTASPRPDTISGSASGGGRRKPSWGRNRSFPCWGKR
jgi:predicted  nucleic acid-binding Zn ribbon protein